MKPAIKAIVRTFILLAAVSPSSISCAENGPAVMTITEGLRLATENNHLVKIATQDMNMSSDDALIAKSRLYPSLNASVSQTFLSNQPGAHFGPQNVTTAERSSSGFGINAYQTIYNFGADTSRYEEFMTLADSRKLNIALTKNLVALHFIITYFDVLETEKMMAVAQKEVESLGSHVKVAESLYNEGVITKNDLLQGVVRLSDARQRLLTVKNQRSVNASRLNNVLSRKLNSEVRLEDVPVNAVAANDFSTIENAWETAENKRLEPAILDKELRAADLEETVKKSGYLPNFFAQAGYNYAENRYQLHEDNWSVLFGMNINLLSGGSTKAEVAKVRHRKQQLLEQRDKLVDDIKSEVERYYLDMKNAAEKILATKDSVSQAEENLRINRVRYEEGIGTSTDVIDAISLLTTAETNYQRSGYEFKRAQAGLLYATGTDLTKEYR